MKKTVKKILIRAIVVWFLAITVLWFFSTLFTSNSRKETQTWAVENTLSDTTKVVVTNPENVDVNAPENTDAQIIVTENENLSEMDKVTEVMLDDGTIDLPTESDFSDSLQLTQA